MHIFAMRTLYFSFLPFLSWICFAAEKNIIFFITDDQSPTLGCYGDPVAEKRPQLIHWPRMGQFSQMLSQPPPAVQLVGPL